jgi:hypothetical protein
MSSEKIDDNVRESAARCEDVHAGAGVAVGMARIFGGVPLDATLEDVA